MAITPWNPATKISRGNVAVGIAPAVVSLSAPSVAELTTGIGLEGSIATMNGTSNADNQTVSWLADLKDEQLPGGVTHSMDDLTIKVDGQTDDSLYTALAVGTTVYVWRRDGKDHSTAVAAGDKVWVWKAIITSVDPVDASNTFVGIVAHVAVLDRTSVPVAVVA